MGIRRICICDGYGKQYQYTFPEEASKYRSIFMEVLTMHSRTTVVAFRVLPTLPLSFLTAIAVSMLVEELVRQITGISELSGPPIAVPIAIAFSLLVLLSIGICTFMFSPTSMLSDQRRRLQYLLYHYVDLDAMDFSVIRDCLLSCQISPYRALKFLEHVYVQNYYLYNKGYIEFVYNIGEGAFEGVRLNGTYVYHR